MILLGKREQRGPKSHKDSLAELGRIPKSPDSQFCALTTGPSYLALDWQARRIRPSNSWLHNLSGLKWLLYSPTLHSAHMDKRMMAFSSLFSKMLGQRYRQEAGLEGPCTPQTSLHTREEESEGWRDTPLQWKDGKRGSWKGSAGGEREVMYSELFLILLPLIELLAV